MNETLLIIWLAAVGAAVGSFLNVVIYRLPHGESLVSPPSHCPKCNHKIRFYDNLPIFGWFLLGGKCRDCKLPISFRYPLIETVACAIVATFACLLMQFDANIEQILVQIFWLATLHLFLLTLGMIDFDRQTLKPLFLALFLAPFLIFGVVFAFHPPIKILRPPIITHHTPFDLLIGGLVAMIVGFVATKIIRVNDHTLWLFASLAVGGFLGWQMAIAILLATLPCHIAIVFVTRRSCTVLALAMMSFAVNVWMLWMR